MYGADDTVTLFEHLVGAPLQKQQARHRGYCWAVPAALHHPRLLSVSPHVDHSHQPRSCLTDVVLQELAHDG
jgi:hypothetical protein